MRRVAALLLLLAITVPATAGTVYKCSSAAGNAGKLQCAFQSDQPPLQQRDNELRAQLANC